MATTDTSPSAARPVSADGSVGRLGGSAIAVILVVTAAFSNQFGAALAAQLFPQVGAVAVVSMRLSLAALVLLGLTRPRLRGYRRNDWATLLAFGVVLAAMNHLFYESIARIPLGVAVTLEILGPLVLSVVISRRLSSLVWAGLALAGVALLAGATGATGLDPVGVAFALGAGAMWAAYTVLSRRAGGSFPRVDGLALALGVAALLSLPWGVATAGRELLDPRVLLIALGVAVLSSALPYGLELVSLRTLRPATFAVLLSLNPVTATAAGYLVLQQAHGGPELLGMVLVVVASAGALRAAAMSGPGQVAPRPRTSTTASAPEQLR